MQRDEPNMNMPGGFKNSRGDEHTSTSSDLNNAVPASALRATSGNPYGYNYQVAGPTMGGIPTPYDSHNVEIAKEHLAQNLSGEDKDTLNVASTGHAGRPSLTENIIQGASTAATGAAATGASVIAAARKLISHDDDGEEIADHGVTAPQNDQHGLEFSKQQKSLSDRPPVKTAIQAVKPSDKATYGDLDSPGAHNMSGPLSDRAKVGTPPVVDTNVAKTIADPFGPVKVVNWNDGKRQQDISTPTSEDFESNLDAKPLHHAPINSSTTPSQAGAYHSSSHVRSPLKNEATYVASDPNNNILVSPHVSEHLVSPRVTDHSPLRSELHVAPTTYKPSVNHSALAGAGAVGAGIATASMRHGDQAPVSHTSQTNTTTTAVPVAQAPEVKKIPIAQPPVEVKRIPIAQPPSQIQRPIQTTSSQHVPMSNAPTSHTYSAVPIAAVTAAGTAAAMMRPGNQNANVEQQESIADKVKNLFHHDTSASDVPKDNSANVAATEASVLLAEQEYASKHAPTVSSTTHTTAPFESRPLSEKITSPIAGAAPAMTGTAAYLGAKNDAVKDSNSGLTHTSHATVDAPVSCHYDTELASGARYADPAVHSTHTLPGVEKVTTNTEKITAPIAGAALGTAAYLGARTHHDAPVTHGAPVVNTASVSANQKVTTTTAEHTGPSRPLTEKVTAPLVGTAAGTAAYMGAKKDGAKGSTTHVNTTDGHSASEYGPADPKDLHMGVTAATMAVPDSHTTTSVPVDHTATIEHHDASEYGPANPKDLHLDYPTMIRPLGAPIAAAAAGAAAAVGAKEMNKEPKTTTTSHTTHTPAPAAHVESVKPVVAPTATSNSTTTTQKPIVAPVVNVAPTSTTHPTTTTKPSPVLTAPHPVIPVTSNAKTTTTTQNNAAPLAAATVAAAAAPTAASAYRNTTTPTTYNNPVPPGANTTTSSSYPTTNTTPGLNNTLTSSSVRRSSASPGEIDSADKIATAIPATYKGPIPVVNPGEKVIWVKTITTTDFYDDEAAGVIDRNGDVVSTQQNVLTPNAYATARDGTTTYTNVENQTQVHDGGRRHSSGFLDRLMGRHSSPNSEDKGKQRRKTEA